MRKAFGWKKAVLVYLAAILLVAAVLFIPAGSLDYWQAWFYLSVLFIPVLFAGSYLIIKDPDLLARRMQLKEKERTQKKIIGWTWIWFIISFSIPGLDHRFGWTSVSNEVVYAAGALVFLGYALNFLVFKENTYASRIIEVVKGQKVISTGPYAVVRHPMYSAVSIMYLFTPLALGSLIGVLFFLPIILVVAVRAVNEEKTLLKKLRGYKAYCKKVRYRLMPFVW